MIFGPSRKRRPSPIQIPEINKRQEDEQSDRTPLAQSPLLSATTNNAFPTSLGPKFSFNKSAAVPALSTRTISAVRTTTTVATQSQSPTRTTFITVIQSIKSPKEKGLESPDPTQTVFISASAQVVTVTAPAIVAVPTADTRPPPKPQAGGTVAIARGALIPVIALSVIAGVAIIFTVLIIIWRRKKRRDERKLSEQRAMAQRDSGGFRAIPDTRPILL